MFIYWYIYNKLVCTPQKNQFILKKKTLFQAQSKALFHKVGKCVPNIYRNMFNEINTFRLINVRCV